MRIQVGVNGRGCLAAGLQLGLELRASLGKVLGRIGFGIKAAHRPPSVAQRLKIIGQGVKRAVSARARAHAQANFGRKTHRADIAGAKGDGVDE